MGTNYYWIKDACAHCHRGAERVHIGKSSAGWEFHFAGYDDGCRSFADWKQTLLDQRIEDEYGRETSLDELIALIQHKRGGVSHQRIALRRDLTAADQKYIAEHPSDYLVNGFFGAGDCWIDAEGYGFSRGEFS